MFETILTLITRRLGVELPPEPFQKICQNAIVGAPWCADILDIRELILRPRVPYTYNTQRLLPMRAAVNNALWDFMDVREIPEKSRAQEVCAKYTAAHRKKQQSFDIKVFCLDMERQHTNNSFMDVVPRFDGWITCGKPVGKYRKFELAAMFPNLYGKYGWANKLKKQ